MAGNNFFKRLWITTFIVIFYFIVALLIQALMGLGKVTLIGILTMGTYYGIKAVWKKTDK